MIHVAQGIGVQPRFVFSSVLDELYLGARISMDAGGSVTEKAYHGAEPHPFFTSTRGAPFQSCLYWDQMADRYAAVPYDDTSLGIDASGQNMQRAFRGPKDGYDLERLTAWIPCPHVNENKPENDPDGVDVSMFCTYHATDEKWCKDLDTECPAPRSPKGRPPFDQLPVRQTSPPTLGEYQACMGEYQAPDAGVYQAPDAGVDHLRLPNLWHYARFGTMQTPTLCSSRFSARLSLPQLSGRRAGSSSRTKGSP